MKLKNIFAATAIAVSSLVAAPVMAAGGTCPTGSVREGESYTSIAECNI